MAKRAAGDTTLVWFRRDLRVVDNPALYHAAANGNRVVPVFIWRPEEEGRWPPSDASQWWLHQSLRSLQRSLREKGSRLIIRLGSVAAVLHELAQETGARGVFWNRRYEPHIHYRDTELETGLVENGLQVRTFNSALLFEPWATATKQGTPFRVFTPFWKACMLSQAPPEPLPEPHSLRPIPKWPRSLKLKELALEPAVDWAGGLCQAWQPGEAGALDRLEAFVRDGADDYHEQRDIPGVKGTSRLSPHLHFGEIGPRQVWHAIEAVGALSHKGGLRGRESFLRQLFWREFAHHVLYHNPASADVPLRPAFEHFPWRDDDEGLRAWQSGRTGYPWVDAGMRELWATGWMHNRVRLAAASFLVKHLLIPWQEGARWFWDTLVDADLANNSMGWQWTAGCGVDAAPYFRIFNPIAQGGRFDPDGTYVRRWVPQIAGLPDRFVHCPWQAPAEVLMNAGVVLGTTYPHPIVDHAHARARALDAYDEVKGR